MHRSRSRVARIGGAVLVLVVSVSGLSGFTDPVPDTYVALGDSYVAGPLIPDATLEGLGCLRSTRNYPSQLAPLIPVAHTTDMSCNGAGTWHLSNPQSLWAGPPNPAQLSALDEHTKVVTLGIGGNDVGFAPVLQDCLRFFWWQTPCKATWAPTGGTDIISARITALAGVIDAHLDTITATVPQAEVFVVGYPSIFPDSIADACFGSEPFLAVDQEYFAAKTRQLNAMLAVEAAEAGVHYVDVYTAGQDHDVCEWDRWVEGMSPRSDALIMHPNVTGMSQVATLVAAAVNDALS